MLQFSSSVPAFLFEGGERHERLQSNELGGGIDDRWRALRYGSEISRQDTSLNFTVHINNYAGVDSETLAEAEKFAAGIFRKSGVETRWVTALGPSGETMEEESIVESTVLSNLRLSILPRSMSNRFAMRDTVMGLAPGSGANRKQIYVFYSKVEELAKQAGNRDLAGPQYFQVTRALVLGNAIAHEIGHILLNLEKHTATGIMRGNWNMDDLLEAASGRLVFSTQQAEVIRTEVARRMNQQVILQTAGLQIMNVAR